MTLFEPLFIAVLVALVTGVFVGAFRWRRGNRSGAIRLLKQLCLWVTVYRPSTSQSDLHRPAIFTRPVIASAMTIGVTDRAKLVWISKNFGFAVAHHSSNFM